jgi:cell division protein FtsB
LSSLTKIAYFCGLAVAAGFLVYALIHSGGSGKQVQLQRELEKTLEENQHLKEENRRLSKEVDALNRRQDYLEKLARDELGLVRKDELILDLKNLPFDGTESSDGSK